MTDLRRRPVKRVLQLLLLSLQVASVHGSQLACEPCIKRANTTVFSFLASRPSRSVGEGPRPSIAVRQIRRAQVAAAGVLGIKFESPEYNLGHKDWSLILPKEFARVQQRGVSAIITTSGEEAASNVDTFLQLNAAQIPVFTMAEDSQAFHENRYEALSHFGIDYQNGMDGLGPAMQSAAGRPFTVCFLIGVQEEDYLTKEERIQNQIDNQRLVGIEKWCTKEGLKIVKVMLNDCFESKTCLPNAHRKMDIEYQKLLDANEDVLIFSTRDSQGTIVDSVKKWRPAFYGAGHSLTVGHRDVSAHDMSLLADGHLDLIVHESLFLMGSLSAFQGWHSVLSATLYATTRMIVNQYKIWPTGPFFISRDEYIRDQDRLNSFVALHDEGFPICNCPSPVSGVESDILKENCATYGQCPSKSCSLPCIDLRKTRIEGMSGLGDEAWNTVRGGLVAAARDFRVNEPSVFIASQWDAFDWQLDILGRSRELGFGTVFVPGGPNTLAMAQTADVSPLVTIMYDVGTEELSKRRHFLGFVGSGNFRGGYDLCSHFLSLGRQHVLAIEFTSEGYSQARGKGCVAAFQERGLKGTRQTVWWDTAGGDAVVRDSMVDQISLQPDIDAVVVTWAMADGLMMGAEAVGRTPGVDISFGLFEATIPGRKYAADGKIGVMIESQRWMIGYYSILAQVLYQATGEKLALSAIITDKLVTPDVVRKTEYSSIDSCKALAWTPENVGTRGLPSSVNPADIKGFPVCPGVIGCAPGFGGFPCTMCPPGSYSFFNVTHQVCQPCPAGALCSSPGTAASPSAEGLADARKRWPEEFISGQVLVWLECPRGHFCPAGSSAALSCAAGTFSNVTGLASAEECQQCEPGFFSLNDGGGAVTCSPCSKGSFSDRPGSVSCSECAIGSYQDMTGQTSCADCPSSAMITLVRGAARAEECVCDRGHYLVGAQLESPWKSDLPTRQCRPCATGWVCDELMPIPGMDGLSYHKPELQVRFYLPEGEFDPGKAAYLCPGEEKACPGGLPGSCTRGGSGINCAKCTDVDGVSYYLKDYKYCAECGEAAGVMVTVVGLILSIVVIVIFYILLLPYNRRDLLANREKYTRILIITTTAGIEVAFIQILWVMGQIKTGWPKLVKDFFGGPGGLFEMNWLSTRCLTGDDTLRLPLITLCPIVIPGVLVVEYAVLLKCTKKSSRHQPSKMMLYNTLWSLFEIFFLIIFNNSLNNVFAVDSHANGDLTVSHYPFILLGSDEWMALVPWGVLGVLFWCCGYLAVQIYVIHKRREWTPGRKAYDYCLFVYRRYRAGYAYYGIFLLLCRALVVMALSLFPAPAHQMIFIIAITLTQIALSSLLNPMTTQETAIISLAFNCMTVVLLGGALAAEAELADERLLVSNRFGDFIVTFITMSCYVGVLVGLVLCWKLGRHFFRHTTVNGESVCQHEKEGLETFELLQWVVKNLGAVLENEASTELFKSYLMQLNPRDCAMLKNVAKNIKGALLLSDGSDSFRRSSQYLVRDTNGFSNQPVSILSFVTDTKGSVDFPSAARADDVSVLLPGMVGEVRDTAQVVGEVEECAG